MRAVYTQRRRLVYEHALTSTRPSARAPPPAEHHLPPEPPKRVFKKGPWLAGGLVIYGFTFCGGYFYRSYRRAVAESQQLDVPLDASGRFDEMAEEFDDEVDASEQFLGLGKLRRQLVKNARGNVLEISVGTGRNLEFYPLDNMRSLTMLDKSEAMITTARNKFNALYPQYGAVTFQTQDASLPMTTPPPSGYDTIVQTMGLCSTPEPEKLLRNLGAVVDPEHGQILLLEHGRSHYQWLNTILDSLAPRHAQHFGCWWNKDIGKIVDDAGLNVVSIDRYHLGTTWRIELRPKQTGR